MKLNQLKAGVVLSYVSMGIETAVSLVYTPIIIRILGNSEFGLYNLVSSTIGYLGLMSFGLTGSYMRFFTRYKMKKDEEGLARLNGMFLIVFCVIAVLAVVAGCVLTINADAVFGDGLSQQELKLAGRLMFIAVINIALTFPSIIFNSIITANEKFTFQRALVIAGHILNPLLTLPLLLMGFRSISLVVVVTAITLMKLLAGISYCIKKLHTRFLFGRFDTKLMKEIFAFSFFIFLNSAIDQVNWNVSKFILGRNVGTVSVAVYSVGIQLNTYYTNISLYISSVFVPRVHRLEACKDNRGLTSLFIRIGRIQFLVVAAVLLGFITLGKYFISIWAGEGFENAYTVCLFIMIPGLIPLIQNIGIEIQRAKNMHRFRSVVYALIAVITVTASVPLSKIYGETGCAFATGAALVVGNIFIMNIYYHTKIKLDMVRFWKSILSMLPGLVIPVIVCAVIMNTGTHNIIQFIWQGMVYLAAYLVSMWFLGMGEDEKAVFRKAAAVIGGKQRDGSKSL